MNTYYSQHDIYITGISSIWLLLAIIISILYPNQNINTNILILLYIFIFTVSVISTLMWKYYNNNNILYYCDLFCAKFLFIILFYFYNYYEIYNYYKLLFPISVLFTYLLGWILIKYLPKISIFFHLLMRLIGFWWTCFTLISPSSIFFKPITIICVSLSYYIYIICSFKYTNNISNFTSYYYYNKGCYHTFLYIFLFIITYFSLYYTFYYIIFHNSIFSNSIFSNTIFENKIDIK